MFNITVNMSCIKFNGTQVISYSNNELIFENSDKISCKNNLYIYKNNNTYNYSPWWLGFGSNDANLNIGYGTNCVAYMTSTTNSSKLCRTITHVAPLESDDEIEVGCPVFATDKVYKLNGETGLYEPSTSNDRFDCISSVKSSGTYRDYLGICVQKHDSGDTVEVGDAVMQSIILNQPSITFATHGDFMMTVTDSSIYSIGDLITYDGTVISDDTTLTVKLSRSIAGQITAIIDENTISVFKK